MKDEMAVLKREFEALHSIKWENAAFSVRACWVDAWLTATAIATGNRPQERRQHKQGKTPP
jgi:hypothetical protein